MTPVQLRDIINIFTEATPEESYIANLCLHNFNLDDENLKFCLIYIDEWTDDYLSHHRHATMDRIQLVRRFIKWLQTLPEDLRENIRD